MVKYEFMGIDFALIYIDLYGLMLIHICFNVFMYVFDVFMGLVLPVSQPQALFCG